VGLFAQGRFGKVSVNGADKFALFNLSGCRMNILERRQIVKGRVIDAVVAKAAVSQSRRQRLDATRKLSKALAASRYASIKADTISYPRQAHR
jgi:hypothetical protein